MLPKSINLKLEIFSPIRIFRGRACCGVDVTLILYSVLPPFASCFFLAQDEGEKPEEKSQCRSLRVFVDYFFDCLVYLIDLMHF